MNEIIIGFSRPKKYNPFSALIMWAGKSDFSHAYIKYFDQFTKQWMIFQASSLKVNFESEERFLEKEEIIAEFVIPISDRIKRKTLQWAQNTVGSPYGTLKILGFAWVVFCRKLGKKVSNPFQEKGSFFCSELATCVLEDEIKDGDDMDPSTAMPVDVFNFLLTKNYKRLK
jgi:hypothetical protein